MGSCNRKTSWWSALGLDNSKNRNLGSVPLAVSALSTSSSMASTSGLCDIYSKKKKAGEEEELIMFKRLKIDVLNSSPPNEREKLFTSYGQIDVGTHPCYRTTKNEFDDEDMLSQPKSLNQTSHDDLLYQDDDGFAKNFSDIDDIILKFDNLKPEIRPIAFSSIDDKDKNIYFRRLTSNGYGLVKGSSMSYDLKSAYVVSVPRGGSALVKTDLQIILPKNMIGSIYTKSPLDPPGLMGKKLLQFNSEYRDNIAFPITNNGTRDMIIYKGQIVGLLIFNSTLSPEFIEVL